MSFVALARRFTPRRLVRPWALCAPIIVLLISIPLLRPIRTPDPSLISDDEQSRLATIQAIVETHSLAIEGTDFRKTHDKIVAVGEPDPRFPAHYYSNQPPMLSLILSGPYWAMHRAGINFQHQPNLIMFWLTLLGVTLPVALCAGLVYRMGRIFELSRPLRMVLGLIVVLASGLISYSTVLNAHAPAAALVLASAACLIHVIVHGKPVWEMGWLVLAGFCAALAAAIDPPALAFLLALTLVILAFHWRLSMKLAGLACYGLGAALPVGVHARLNRAITGDMRPGMFHAELAYARPKKEAGESENKPRANKADDGHPKNPLFGVSSVATASLPARSLSPGAATSTLSRPAGSMPVASSPPVAAPPILAMAADDDDEAQSPLGNFWQGLYHILGTFVGRHGVFTHFPVMLLGILGVSMIMHRHWPSSTKMLAGVTLGAALSIMLVYALCRSNPHGAMFATRWFVVFLPLTLFWCGAWLRRSHRQSSWVMAGILLAFSVIVSLIGATGPFPRNGFDRYSAAGAWHNLIHPPLPVPASSVVAERQ